MYNELPRIAYHPALSQTELRVQGSGSRVWERSESMNCAHGSGFRVWGLGFGV